MAFSAASALLSASAGATSDFTERPRLLVSRQDIARGSSMPNVLDRRRTHDAQLLRARSEPRSLHTGHSTQELADAVELIHKLDALSCAPASFSPK